MAADLTQLKQQIDDLRQEYLKLTAKPAYLFNVGNIADAEKAVDTLTKAVAQAREEAHRLEEGFGGIAASVGKIVAELANSRTPLNLATSAFKRIEESVKKLKYDQQGLSDLNKKQLQDEIKKQGIAQQTIREQAQELAQEKGIVDITKVHLGFRRDLSVAERAILEGLKEGFPIFDEINDKLSKRLEKEKEFQKALGVTGKIAGLFGKIPFFGAGASEALKDTEAEIRALDRAGKPIPTRFQTIGILLKNLKGSVKESLTDPLVVVGTLATMLAKSFLESDKSTTQLQKNLTISRGEALQINKEFTLAALNFDSLAINSRTMAAYFGAVQEKIGSVGKTSIETAQTFARLNKAVGLSENAAAGLTVQSDAFGKNQKENYITALRTSHQVSQQYKTHISEKAVLEDVGKASSYTLTQFKGSTQALTEGVAKAKALGMSLEVVNKTAGSLLNFQQSIEDELAAEVLSGRQLNLEQARYYALTNQQSKLMDELATQVGTYSDFMSQNALSQDAQAKALGMTSTELSDILLKEQYRNATAADIANIADEDIQKRVETLTVQEKLQLAMDKFSATMADLVSGPLAQFLFSMQGIYTIIGLISGVMIGKMAAAFVPVITKATTLLAIEGATAIATTTTATAVSFGAMLPVILGAAGAVAGLIAGINADDLFSEGGYGKRTLITSEGAFKLNDRDNIIATTNPINVSKANDLYSGPESSLKANTGGQQIAIAPSSTRISLFMNSAAVGNAEAIQDYSISKRRGGFGNGVDFSASV